jgi:hypothetical protein
MIDLPSLTVPPGRFASVLSAERRARLLDLGPMFLLFQTLERGISAKYSGARVKSANRRTRKIPVVSIDHQRKEK